MESNLDSGYVAFRGKQIIARGEIEAVAKAVKQTADTGPQDRLVVYDDKTSQVIELDLRGTVDDVVSRLPDHPILREARATSTRVPEPTDVKPAGPGRPKLGVVSREVSLLPRHWDWLAKQSGGASAAIRRLVEEARKAHHERDRRAEAQQAAHRFLWDMAGNEPNFEEVSRALYAADFDKVRALSAQWPADVRDHALRLIQRLVPEAPRG
jgi:uncharacterized protein